MKVILRNLALSLSLAFGATGTLTAEQVFLQCELPGQDQREWVQPSIVLAFETGEAKALVADGIIMYYNENPIWSEKRENANRILLNWNITGTSDRAGNPVPSMHYVLELKKKDYAISVRARPQGYANMFRGKGTCRPLENRASMERILKRMK